LAETDEFWLGTSPWRDMTSLFIEFRDKPSKVPALLIDATSAATEARGPPILKSSKKPNVRSLARERSGWTVRQKILINIIIIIICIASSLGANGVHCCYYYYYYSIY